MANPLKKTASVIAAFTLAAAAFATPMPAQAEGFFDDFKAGMKQGLDRRGNQGGIGGAVANGMKAIGDKTSEVTGVKSAAQPIPTYVGRTVTGETRVCYTQDPEEKPKYFGNAGEFRAGGNGQGGESSINRTNQRRAFSGAPGNGGLTSGTAMIADIAQTIVTTCGQEVTAGRMRPYGQTPYGTTFRRPDRIESFSVSLKCNGLQANDHGKTGDFLVEPRNMNEVNQYGAMEPIMRCNPKTGYAPIKNGDRKMDMDGGKGFVATSEELAQTANIETTARHAKIMEARQNTTSTAPRGGGYPPATYGGGFGNTFAP